jgi:tetratricopeptide (TPR) repeat protein
VNRVRLLREAGDYPAAAAALRQTIADGEAAYGPDAVQLVGALNELGMVGKYAGHFAEAERAYQRALRICVNRGPAGAGDMASVLHNLAGLAHARGDARSAETLARRGIAVRAALPGVDPLALAADRAALAAILIDLGRYDEARGLLSNAVGIYRERGRPHDLAVALHNLGSAQFRQAHSGPDQSGPAQSRPAVREAAGTLRQAYRLKRAVLGRRHPDLAITLHNLARCQQELGRTARARRNWRRAVRLLRGVVAPDHPTLLACGRPIRASRSGSRRRCATPGGSPAARSAGGWA